MISLRKVRSAVIAAVLATLAVIGVAQAPPASAGAIVRTGIIAYDESQCSCTYSRDYLERITSLVHSMPLVKGVTSYYDTTISARTHALTRPASTSNYFDLDSGGTTWTALEAGLPIHVLCWADATDGSGQIDKVAAMHVVNGVNNMTIFDVPDSFVTAAVRSLQNRC